MNKTLFILICLSLLFSMSSVHAAESKELPATKTPLLIIDSQAKESIERLTAIKGKSDETLQKALLELSPSYQDSDSIKSLLQGVGDTPRTIAVNERELLEVKGLQESVKAWYDQGKQIFLYGQHIKVITAEHLFGITLVPENKEKIIKDKQVKDLQIFGIKKDGHLNQLFMGQITLAGEEGASTSSALRHDEGIQSVLSAVSMIARKHREPVASMLPPGDGDGPYPCMKCNPEPEPDAVVLTGTDANYLYVNYEGASVIASVLYSEWSLNRNFSHDTGSNYDLFYINDSVYLDSYNGAYGKKLAVYHQLPYYQKDDIAGWGPLDSNTRIIDGEWRYYPVKLPWNVSWYSSSYGDLSFTSQKLTNSEETVYWQLTNPPYHARFQPGTAVKSYYTYAYMRLTHTADVQFGNNTYFFSLSRDVIYDY
ncbi:hypothetical protein [Paenibacillus sp. SI8]|uniref:hypothetical protein n=1 Tax=unclassified Paenibacillus TaxID=185978 RepID=UPI003466872B